MNTAVKTLAAVFVLGASIPAVTSAGLLTFGDIDLLGTGTYPTSPTTGATFTGLAPGAVTKSTTVGGHLFPFSPEPDDFPGTDRIYVGANQTANLDGYSNAAQRIAGPQVITMDYSPLLAEGPIATLTLGIAADDFQQPLFGQAYSAKINGTVYGPLTNLLNSLDQTGPVSQYMTMGIDIGLLTPNGLLVLTIEQAGNGGDGWAIDFLTIGTTVPEPTGLGAVGLAVAALGGRRRRA